VSGRIHFLHIGKTGGTAVKHALKPLASMANLALHSHPVRLSDIPAGERVVFLLRDPLTRFVSAFYSRQREGRPRYVVPWSPEEAATFGRFHTPNELANALASTGAVERKFAERAMRAIPHMKRRYWDWLVDLAYLRSRAEDILFIGLQEHLTSDFAVMRRLLAISDAVQLPDDDVDAHRNPASLDRTLDSQAVRNLKVNYREDYVALRECRRLALDRKLGGSICEAAWIEAEI
jgi:hypothetical protein